MPGGNEYLLNNAIGEDLRRALRPFDLVRELVLVPKYRIQDNFITPRSRKYYMFSLLFLLFLLCAYQDIRDCKSYKWCFMITYVLYPVAYATVVATAAYHSMSAVELVTKMQGINKKLRVIGASDLSHFSKRNWSYVVCAHIVHVFRAILIITEYNALSVYTRALCCIIVDLEILYTVCIIDFLLSRLNTWLILLVNSSKRSHISIGIESNDVDANANTSLLIEVVRDIFKAFEILKKMSQFVVSVYAVLIFAQWILSTELFIMITNNQIPATHLSIPSKAFFIFNFAHLSCLIILSTTCEAFYFGVGQVKKSCAEILDDANCTEKSTRRLAKNVLRLCRVRYREMRACGLFAVDAALPLRLLGLITTYCVVVLQFAFL